MPYKAKKPCAYRGCRELTRERYCRSHKKLEAKHYDKYRRSPSHKKRYGSSWRKIRNAFMKANPLCEICLEEGILTPSTQAHHKRKVADGGTNDWENLQALCGSCHSRLHAKEGDYF